MNGERANYTQHNNMQATRNLVFGLEEHDLTETHFIETTTTGVHGASAFPIPEGAVMESQGQRDEVPFPAMAGSWYHMTKSHDAANLRLAHSQFDIPISDVRTAIIYGTGIEETRADDRLATRFDCDYYFGVVTHRFIAQAIAGYPITVYGKGEQRKPFIALEDPIEGLTRLALTDPAERPADHVVYNQVTRPISIVEMGTTIANVATKYGYDTTVEHFENPQDEDETHKMEIENDRYAELIGGQSVTFTQGVETIFAALSEYDSPLLIGHDDATYIGSDATAFIEHTNRVTYLESGDIAHLTPGEVTTYADGNRVERETETLDWDAEAAGKSGYDQYMLKEIHEQPRALRQTISGRINELETTVSLDVDLPTEYLRSIDEIQIIACGTSYHAGLYAKTLLETHADIRVSVHVASEYEFEGGRDPYPCHCHYTEW